MADLGERYSPQRASLKAYEIYDDAQKEALQRLADFKRSLAERIAACRGIIFVGTVGTGKDHLLAAMLYNAAWLGLSCRWVNGQEVFGQFRDNIDSGQRDEVYFRELVKPTVLGISDMIPPRGDLGAWDITNMYRLLDRRYRAMRSTWVSINAVSVEDADQRLTAPVFDRLREGAEIFSCFWPSYRERKKA